MKKLLILTSFLLIAVLCFSQQGFNNGSQQANNKIDYSNLERNTVDFGFGFGLDYGGLLGVKLNYVPLKHLALFASGGYHLVAFGWQVGAIVYAMPKVPKKKARLYGKAMYGTNRAIMVDGDPDLDKNYVGFTPGIGLEVRFGKKRGSGINMDLNFPISSQEFKDDLQYLQDSPMYDIGDPLPVAFSIGYHFEL